MNIKKSFFQMWKKFEKSTRKEKNMAYCEAIGFMKNHPETILLDVRSTQEYKEYHLNHAINIPLYELNSKARSILTKNQIIIVYCQSGARSKKACKILERYGI